MLILMVLIFFAARQLDRSVGHVPDHRWHLPVPGRQDSSWWASKVRQFRAHLRARVTPEERRRWRPGRRPAQLALFDSMHVADRRHGLDVVASLRADGVTEPDVLVAGLLHDAGKGDTGVWPRVAYSLGQQYGTWIWRVAAVVPGFGASLERLRTHAETSAVARRACRLLGADRRADPLAGRAARPRVRRAAPPRRRGQLMTGVPVMADAPAIGRRAGGPASRPAGGPRAATQVQVAEFEGPLGLLLSLIEARRLDVLTVPLGRARRTPTSMRSRRSRRTGSATSARSWRSPAS